MPWRRSAGRVLRVATDAGADMPRDARVGAFSNCQLTLAGGAGQFDGVVAVTESLVIFAHPEHSEVWAKEHVRAVEFHSTGDGRNVIELRAGSNLLIAATRSAEDASLLLATLRPA